MDGCIDDLYLYYSINIAPSHPTTIETRGNQVGFVYHKVKITLTKKENCTAKCCSEVIDYRP
jgi:hypothetical protein